jgi:hypothetical protein
MIAEPVRQEMPAPSVAAGLDHLQYRTRVVGDAGRKIALASVGFCAFIVDGAVAVYKGGVHLFSSAELRGQRMSRDLTRRFGDFEEHAVGEMRKLQGQMDENVEQLRGSLMDAKSGADEDLEKRIELILSNMGLPSRERLERLSQEIDDLNQKLDQQLRRLPDRPIADPLG